MAELLWKHVDDPLLFCVAVANLFQYLERDPTLMSLENRAKMQQVIKQIGIVICLIIVISTATILKPSLLIYWKSVLKQICKPLWQF